MLPLASGSSPLWGAARPCYLLLNATGGVAPLYPERVACASGAQFGRIRGNLNVTVLTPAECRNYGDVCAKLAVRSSDPIERKTLLQMATSWRRLANHNAKQEKREKPENSV